MTFYSEKEFEINNESSLLRVEVVFFNKMIDNINRCADSIVKRYRIDVEANHCCKEQEERNRLIRCIRILYSNKDIIFENIPGLPELPPLYTGERPIMLFFIYTIIIHYFKLIVHSESFIMENGKIMGAYDSCYNSSMNTFPADIYYDVPRQYSSKLIDFITKSDVPLAKQIRRMLLGFDNLPPLHQMDTNRTLHNINTQELPKPDFTQLVTHSEYYNRLNEQLYNTLSSDWERIKLENNITSDTKMIQPDEEQLLDTVVPILLSNKANIKRDIKHLHHVDNNKLIEILTASGLLFGYGIIYDRIIYDFNVSKELEKSLEFNNKYKSRLNNKKLLTTIVIDFIENSDKDYISILQPIYYDEIESKNNKVSLQNGGRRRVKKRKTDKKKHKKTIRKTKKKIFRKKLKKYKK